MKGSKSIWLTSLLALLPLLFLLFSLSSPASAQTKTLKIGLITSVTGPMAPAFKPMFDAAKPAEELINSRGGFTVAGQKYTVTILPEDDQSGPQGAVAAANRLVQQGVKFIVSPMFMATDLAFIPIAEEAKVVHIKAFGMGPEELNPKTKYGFFADSSLYNIKPCYDYFEKNYPKAKRIAMITPDDPGVSFALSLNDKENKSRGLQAVFEERFKIGSEDFYPLLTKALDQKPDAINAVVSIVPWAAALINQARELGFKGPIFCPCMFGDLNLINGMLQKQYAYDIFHGGPDVLSDKMHPLVKDLRKRVEATKPPYVMDSLLPLDAVFALLQAIEKAQSTDPDAVVAAIGKMKTIDTIWGKGHWGGKEFFGVDQCIVRPVTISRIVNGKVEQLDFIPVK